MDAGRFVLRQPGWDTNSVLDSYSAARDPEFRIGGAFGCRGLLEAPFPRENGYLRSSLRRELLLERESLPLPAPALGLWPPTRRRTLEEELAIIRGVHRHEKVGFIENFREIGSYREIDGFRDADKFRDIDNFRDIGNYRDITSYRDIDTFRDISGFRDYGYDRINRFPTRERESFEGDDYDYRRWVLRGSREGSWDHDLRYPRLGDYDSDHEHGRRDHDWRKQERERETSAKSRDRDRSPGRDRRRDHSRSRSHSHSRSRSHDNHGQKSRSPRSHGRVKREGSQEESRNKSRSEKSGKKRERDDKSHHERASVAPSATVVVKGLSQKTVEDDLYKALTEWGPLRHARVIKERSSGISRGFAFVDFPSVDAAQKMMNAIGEEGLVIDGRRLFFEYSSKPTGGLGGPQTVPAVSACGPAPGASKSSAPETPATVTDWMCTVCGCVNFARRTSCFQCNEGRAEDAPVADVSSSTPATGGKRGSEAVPTHVLVVRGLDEHVNEETLHYEFSKHAPIKDLRLVRDKFTHVSRGFAFIHFHSVEDASKALELSNGITLEKNGQVLRVAYAKSIQGPGPGSSNVTSSQNNSLAAAAIEAATFAQQYDAAGWAPKEYNPDQESGGNQQGTGITSSVEYGATDKDGRGLGEGDPYYSGAHLSGFVWDEASGYYYDAASGFYYDGHRGLYYDGNHGIWYSYDQETQQYVPYIEPSGDTGTLIDHSKVVKESNGGGIEKPAEKCMEPSTNPKAVISAPPATVHAEHEPTTKKQTVAKAVQAAPATVQTVSKKEKEKVKEKEKELRLASKGLLLISKKKISNTVSMWKQRQHEGQVAPMAVDEGLSVIAKEYKRDALPASTASVVGTSSVQTVAGAKKVESSITSVVGTSSVWTPVSTKKAEPVSTSMVGPSAVVSVVGTKKIEGVIHTKGNRNRGTSLPTSHAWLTGNTVSGNNHLSESFLKAGEVSKDSGTTVTGVVRGAGKGTGKGETVASGVPSQPSVTVAGLTSTPFKTDASALGSYGPVVAGARRRFTEAPQSMYRDRAAERRSLHGSSGSGDVVMDPDIKDRGMGIRNQGLDMLHPPSVGVKSTGAILGTTLQAPEVQSFEGFSSLKAVDGRNSGNQMLRNMGWQEGFGFGKDVSGMVDLMQGQVRAERVGLGIQAQGRKVDTRFETVLDDNYQVSIQKKAHTRFHEML